MELLERLNWRYATKQFDKEKKVSEEKLNLLKEAISLAPTSYGLQLYKVLVIEDEELREKLKPASWNQSQITDASALLVFCNYTDVKDEHIDEYLELKAKAENLDVNVLKGYGDFMKSKIVGLPVEEKEAWTRRQTYIALGFLLNSAAELEIDACPMEGFEPDQYNEILGLTEQNLNAALIAPIGYRAATDKNQHSPKVRKPMDKLFETISNDKLVAV